MTCLKGGDNMTWEKELFWKKAAEFHGHICPGLAIGFRACEAAIKRLSIDFSSDEEIVCITENDACGVDAIQAILGCTAGKGNLIFKDRGKQAFTFFRRDTNQGIRIVFKGFNENRSREENLQYILDAPLDEIFEYKEPKDKLPQNARIFRSLKCENCGEKTAEHRIRILDGKFLCLDCYEDYSRGWGK